MYNKSKPMVSIITPAHNAGRYIAECIDSVLKQDYQDWELILTDDGSNDETEEICLQYTQKDDRIRLLRQEKCKGVSSARNRGLEEARGEFVIFVDADDLLPENSLTYRITSIDDADLLCANMDEVDEKGRFIKPGLTKCTDSSLNNQDAVRVITVYGEQGYQGYSCNKLFRRSIIEENHIRFNEEVSYNEDRLFCFHYVKNCQRVKMIPEVVYHYRQTQGSAMNKLHDQNETDAKKILSEFQAFDIILDSVKEQYPETFYMLCADAQNKAISAWRLYRRDPIIRLEMKERIKRYGRMALEAPADTMTLGWKIKTVCHSSAKRFLSSFIN